MLTLTQDFPKTVFYSDLDRLVHRRDYQISFAVAVAIHVLLFLINGALIKSAQYGVELGESGIDIELVAFQPEQVQKIVRVEPAPVLPEEIAVPDEAAAKVNEVPAPAQSIPSQKDSPATATIISEGGARSTAKPYYLKNPAPAYPEVARRQGHEGVVILSVSVDAAGKPSMIVIDRSSGFKTLDESAEKTIRHWRFQPAEIGGLVVTSPVKIPVRFQLTN